MNLAAVEMLFCLVIATFLPLQQSKHDGQIVEILDSVLSSLFFIEVRWTMLHIIFDRFLEIYTNIKYPLYMTYKRMSLLLATHWIISALCATINVVLEHLEISGKFEVTFFLGLILDVMILISSISTYIYFYRTVRKIRRLELTAASQPQELGVHLLISKFKLPCYIVLTYTCFNLSSTAMMAASQLVDNEKPSEHLFRFSLVPTLIGFTSDAIIYVFANREVRKLLCSICRWKIIQNANRVDVIL